MSTVVSVRHSATGEGFIMSEMKLWSLGGLCRWRDRRQLNLLKGTLSGKVHSVSEMEK